MPVLKSTVNTQSEEFLANAAAMQEQNNALRDACAKIHNGGGEKARERQVERGTCRGRVVCVRMVQEGKATEETKKRV